MIPLRRVNTTASGNCMRAGVEASRHIASKLLNGMRLDLAGLDALSNQPASRAGSGDHQGEIGDRSGSQHCRSGEACGPLPISKNGGGGREFEQGIAQFGVTVQQRRAADCACISAIDCWNHPAMADCARAAIGAAIPGGCPASDGSSGVRRLRCLPTLPPDPMGPSRAAGDATRFRPDRLRDARVTHR